MPFVRLAWVRNAHLRKVNSAFAPCDQPQNSLNYLTSWRRIGSFGVWLVSEKLIYANAMTYINKNCVKNFPHAVFFMAV